MNKPLKLVTGVIGEDVHVTGIRILEHSLRSEGHEIISLGIHNSQEDFIAAAKENNADALIISSLAGHAEILVEGFKAKLQAAGLAHVKNYIGGQLVIHAEEWSETEARFKALGFDRVSPPFSLPKVTIAYLKEDFKL